MAALQTAPDVGLRLPVSSSLSLSMATLKTTSSYAGNLPASRPIFRHSNHCLSLGEVTGIGQRSLIARHSLQCGLMAAAARKKHPCSIVCGLEFKDFIGGDLLGFDLDQWEADVENHKAIAFYPPHEGGIEGRYATRLRLRGYYFLDLTARGIGDIEAYLSKVHAVRPPHLGKQKIVRWYIPPEVDYRLSLLPEDAKGLVVWIIEAKVLSKAELQYLALLPTLQPKVRVIAECGTWRKVRWKPLREIAGLEVPASSNMS